MIVRGFRLETGRIPLTITGNQRSFDAFAERLRVDEDDQVELDPLRHLREYGADDQLGFGHDLFRCPVVEAQAGQVDPVEPDPFEPSSCRSGRA
jgi:hypothetical protein